LTLPELRPYLVRLSHNPEKSTIERNRALLDLINENQMTDRLTTATWDALKSFGFTEGQSQRLEYDFGNFQLTASRVINCRFANVVMFSGVMTTARSIAEVNFEMELRVDSEELCAAHIAWNLDQVANGRLFQPLRETPWLHEGRNHRHLLPWEKERAESERELIDYRARPQCSIEKDWMKLAIKSLTLHLAKVEDNESVDVFFDGEALSFRVGVNLVVLAGVGSPWRGRFTLPAGNLRILPSRLPGDHIDVSVWRSRLNIGRWCYEGSFEDT